MDRRTLQRFGVLFILVILAFAFATLRSSQPAALGEGASAGPAATDGDREASVASSSIAGQPQAALPTPSSPGVPPGLPANPPLALAPMPAKNQDPKLASPLAELRDLIAAAIARGDAGNLDIQSLLPDDLKSLIEGKLMRLNESGEVQVYVRVDNANAAILEALAMAGVNIERLSDDSTIIQAWLPAVALNAIAGLEPVKSIRLPDYGFVQAGSAMTEGDSIIRADLVRSTYGVTGAGVKVGVISNGVYGMASAQSSGDLPPSVNTTTCNVTGGHDPAASTAGAEGTALMEIVHDIAPDAELWYGYYGAGVSGHGTGLDFNAAVNCLAAHTDVVVDDINFYNVGAYDGTGSISSNTSNALNNESNPIRAYSTSAGNQAIEHYQEAFVDYGGSYPGWHRFQSTADTTDGMPFGPLPVDPLYLQPNGVVVVYLQWNDAFGASSNDYDLYLLNDATGQQVAFSDSVQNGNDDPVEALGYQNTTGTAGWFDIKIVKYSGSVRTLDMFVVPISGGTLLPNGAVHNYNTMFSSVANQSDAGGGVMSVGAIDAADAGHDTIETFSNRGPTNDGRTKPDITAIDGVCVTGSGGFGQGTCQTNGKQFFGTSASAPHVAAVAALLLQCRPDLKAGTPGENASTERTSLRNYIVNNAVDLGAAGTDNVYGSGRIDAYAAAVAAGCGATPTPTRTSTPTPTATSTPTRTPTPSPTPTATVPPCTAIITVQSGSLEAGHQITVRLQASGICAPGLGDYVGSVAYNGAYLDAVNCIADPDNMMDTENCDISGTSVVFAAGFRGSPGATGTVPLADITFQAIGAAGSVSALGVQTVSFVDTSSQPISTVDYDGSIRIGILGDTSKDGNVSMVDAMLIAQCVAGLINCSGIDQTMGNVNCAGGLSMVDAMLIAQKVAGLITNFSCNVVTPTPTPTPT